MEKPNSFVLTENFEMLKALYDFQAVYPKTISFDEGDHFILHQTSARQRNWWQVVSMKGLIGFVPSNYVMKINVEPNFMLGFLDSSIEALKLSKQDESNGIINRLELIERLESKKTQIALSAKALETDAENIFNNETRYANNSKTKSNDSIKSQSQNKTDQSRSNITVTPQLTPFMQDSPSITGILSKFDDISTLTTAHDNSATSDRSETTNTTSDDATVISKAETIEEDSEEMHSQSVSEKNSKNLNLAETISSNNHINKLINESNKLTVESMEVYQIVDSIRQTTGLSHELSCVALRVVLSELEAIYSTKILKFLEPIATHLATPLMAPDEFVSQTHDAQRLKVIFSQLADCKNDSEQRTWMLHEDEDYITKFLIELVEILTNADKKICIYELLCDQYQSVMNLVQYYQMEPRWPIRKLLFKAFKALCHLETNAIDILLTSVLPLELVQDIKSNTDIERLREITIMLTMIFSSGQKMPITHQENISSDLIFFLLNTIEEPPVLDVQEILPDVMINLVLSINLQFNDFTESFVLEAMRQVSSAKTFTEKILILLNREEDPLHFFQHSIPTTNSVLKMFVDLFSTPETASLFYTNDNKVLIDILVRQLSDLSPGDSLRRWYLELCRRIVRNTTYTDHFHRKSDLMKIFTRIFCEEEECSLKDQQLVREIANEFPQIFKT